MGVARRRVLVVALVVGLGAVGWWLGDLYGAPNRADLSAYWQLVVAVVSGVVAVFALARDSPNSRARGGDGGSELDRFADQLAEAVEQQWTDAAMARGLLHPEPIAVRWAQPAKPVAGSAATATASTRFSSLPGLAATRPEQLSQGGLRDLHTVYGGLRSGRLVIAGAPGAGKSGAAVLLVLAALDHRLTVAEADRAKVPVPVLFTLHNWDPSTQPLRDWLVSQLRQTYDGLFIGRRGARNAAELINDGMVTVILDGLDEITEQLRPVALQALSEQAMFRLVVLARSAEIAGAAEQAILDGAVAVELQDVAPATAAKYLTDIQRDPPPPRWRELTEHLKRAPDSPLARALNNPLTLTLVRDTYRTGDSIGELLDFCATTHRSISREDVEDYLLDRILPQAYTTRPGQPPPRYTLPAARRTLGLIAARMSRDQTRDLAWWRIHTWTPTFLRVLTIGAATGLAIWLGFGLLFGFGLHSAEFNDGLFRFTHFVGLVSGLGGMIGAWLAGRNPPPTVPRRWDWLFSHPSVVFVLGLVFGYMLSTDITIVLDRAFHSPDLLLLVVVWGPVGLAIWLLAGLTIRLTGRTRQQTALRRWRAVHRHPCTVFVVGLGFGLTITTTILILSGGTTWAFLLYVPVGVFTLILGLKFGLGSFGLSPAIPLTPFASWSRHRATVLGIWFGLGGLAGGLLIRAGIRGLGTLIPADSVTPPMYATYLGIGLVSGLVLGVVYPENWTTSLAGGQLAIRWRTPVRLMWFLDDARERNVLRTVGPIYQFRHARLQDRLLELHTATTMAPERPCPSPQEQPEPAIPPTHENSPTTD